MIRLSKLFEEFTDMELSLNLFAERIDGVYFWERVRTNLFFEIFNRLIGSDSGSNSSPPRSLQGYKFYLSSILNIPRNPYFVGNRDIVFLGSPRRKKLEDGFWWDIYIDPIIHHMNPSYVNLEYDLAGRHKNPPRTGEIRYLDFLKTIVKFLEKSKVKRVLYTMQESKLLDRIGKEIFERFGVQLNVKQVVLVRLLRRRLFLPQFKLILQRIQPKIAVVVCSYGKEDFIECCKNLNVPVVELQHGVIYPYHPGYSFPKGVKKHTFPDYLFIFGDFWRHSANFPLPKSRILTTGYPYLEWQQAKYKSLPKRKQILFISQPRIGHIVSKFASELRKKLSQSFKIVYKLHPLESSKWEQEYPWLLQSGIEVLGNNANLYKLLAESTIQVGVFSTALFEGLAFNLKTFLINAIGTEQFTPFVQRGLAEVVNAVPELVEKIKQIGQDVSIDTSIFFAPNSIERIVSEIKSIIHRTSS